MSKVGPSGKWTQELLTVKRKKLAGLFENHRNGLITPNSSVSMF